MYTTRKLPNTRIDVADALRGIAVAGIILYHSVELFNIFTQETIIHALPSDQTVADVLTWLLSGKMYGIFAMLCGENLLGCKQIKYIKKDGNRKDTIAPLARKRCRDAV